MLGEYVPNSNTQLLLRLNGNANDSSGKGNNGTATNITYVGGAFGSGSGSFNGSSSFIQTASAATTGSDATFSFWVKILNGNDQCYFNEGNYGDGSMCYLSLGTLYYRFGNTPVVNVTSSTLPTTGVWSHICVTHIGTTATIYVNAVQTATGTVNAKTGSGTSLYIGKLGNLSLYFYPGEIDEFIVESGGWTAKQVQKYYTYAKTRFNLT